MMNRLRIWRVVPTSQTGSQAPYFFVETQQNVLESAYLEAMRLAEEKCCLSKFDSWFFRLEKLSVRKDDFGRYFRYHQ